MDLLAIASSNLLLTCLVVSWSFGGGIQYLIKNDDVRLRPQRIVFTLLCGPLVWFLKSVGWAIELLDYVFAGFKDWLYKKEETKR